MQARDIGKNETRK